MKQLDQCRQFAQEFIEKDLKDGRARFIQLFMRLALKVLDQESDVCDLQSQIISLLPIYKAVELEIPFYSLLIDHYRQHNDLEQVVSLQEKLIHYLKFNFSSH